MSGGIVGRMRGGSKGGRESGAKRGSGRSAGRRAGWRRRGGVAGGGSKSKVGVDLKTFATSCGLSHSSFVVSVVGRALIRSRNLLHIQPQYMSAKFLIL